jgi:phenylacetate-CoA ligase
VIVTGLYNYATPFIRYETGDYARRAADPCRSGRCLSRLKRIEGRKRNALVDRAGRRIWLHDVLSGEAMRRIPASLFQIVQRDLATIELKYIPLPEMGRPDTGELADYFSAILDGAVRVQISDLRTMPRSIGRKHTKR